MATTNRPRHFSGHTEDGKLRFASKIVLTAIANVIAYTITCFVLAFLDKTVPDGLHIPFFGFWGAEVIALALKRVLQKRGEQSEE